MLRMIWLGSWLSIALGCSAARTGWDQSVQSWGTIREVLADQQSQARVLLADAVADSSTFGVGALQGLSGEVTIYQGRVWLAQGKEGEVVTRYADGRDDHATLLVVAQVSAWQDFVLEDELSGADLEQRIHELAAASGIDVDRPFPFLLIGNLAADVHVINGGCPRVDPSADPFRSRLEAEEVMAVGFFADQSEGVLTHHGSRVHIHALVAGEKPETGHVDLLTTRAGAILRLPAG
ncbi:MAG: hypothetical protein ACYTHJ_16995 [Planctomycetota bacterium]|jgi:acetolactate decarboxylase